MKKWRLDGTVEQLKKEDLAKRKTAAAGDKKTTTTEESEAFTAVIVGKDGQRLRLKQADPFDFSVGEDVSVTVEFGKQQKLD